MSGQEENIVERRVVDIAILTPYLSENLGEHYSPEDWVWQVEVAKFNPDNFSGVKQLISDRHLVRLDSPNYDGRKRASLMGMGFNPALVIAGSTEPGEDEVEGLKGTGLVVARYSMFYGGPSGYSGRSPGDGGYALDIPKDVGVVRDLLTDDNVLDALVARELGGLVGALDSFNQGRIQPVLATPYLETALSIELDAARNVDLDKLYRRE